MRETRRSPGATAVLALCVGALGCGSSSPSAVTSGPIDAPAGIWTWVAFPDAVCADGSATGIGVNLGAPGSRPLIYLEGGGACWSEQTCYTLMTATNFATGYGPQNFAADIADVTEIAAPGGFFDRTAADNPFKDWSYVYVPYCTGDVHAGDAVVQYGSHTAHHVGYTNLAAYLARLVPTFAGADRIVLAGSSAGGYGALLNWGQTQAAFGSARVDMIDDSGTLMPPDIVALGNGDEAAEKASWNLAGAALPAGCTTCADDLSAVYGYYAQTFADHRAALLSYTQDSVIPIFYGITTAQFTTGLDEVIASQIAPAANFKSFQDDAAGHVLWFAPTLASSGVTVKQFVTQMVTDDATWANVAP